jgi:LPS sulfotransferase NodH
MLGIRSETERRYKEKLRSPDWDVGDGAAPKLQYVLLSLARTGSEWVCAALRRRGIGIPIEYLTAVDLAQRVGCASPDGKIHVPAYLAQLRAKRTTPNGVFGLKLHPLHLRMVSGDEARRAVEFLGHFDRILFLRRRDRLLQAISLARALLTGQFHIVPGDAPRPVAETDDTLFREIATQLARLLEDEHYAAGVVALVDPRRVTELWYEDLTDATIDGLASTLAPLGATAVTPTTDSAPRRGDAEEALAIKRRFLAHVGAPPL